MCPATRRSNNDLFSARFTMQETVLTRMVNIEFVVSMLYRTNPQSTGTKFTHKIYYKGGFPGIFKARYSKYFHNRLLLIEPHF